MKIRIILALLLGIILGAVVTYFSVANQEDEFSGEVVSVSDDASECEVLDEEALASEDNRSLGRLDMKNPSDRDLFLSHWYLEMMILTSGLEARSGHDFGDVWKGRAPAEILEEHLDYIGNFDAETRKIARRLAEQRAKENEYLAEQCAAP